MRLRLAMIIGTMAGSLGGCLAPQKCYLTLNASGGPTAEACEDGPNLLVRPITPRNSAYYVPTYVLAALSYEGYLTLPSPGAVDSDWLDRPVFDEGYGGAPARADQGAEGSEPASGQDDVVITSDPLLVQSPQGVFREGTDTTASGEPLTDRFGRSPQSDLRFDTSRSPKPPLTLWEFIRRHFFREAYDRPPAERNPTSAAATEDWALQDMSSRPDDESRTAGGLGPRIARPETTPQPRGTGPRLARPYSRPRSRPEPRPVASQDVPDTRGSRPHSGFAAETSGRPSLDARFGWKEVADLPIAGGSLPQFETVTSLGTRVAGLASSSPLGAHRSFPEQSRDSVTLIPVDLGEGARRPAAPAGRIAPDHSIDGAVMYRRPLPALDFPISGDFTP